MINGPLGPKQKPKVQQPAAPPFKASHPSAQRGLEDAEELQLPAQRGQGLAKGAFLGDRRPGGGGGASGKPSGPEVTNGVPGFAGGGGWTAALHLFGSAPFCRWCWQTKTLNKDTWFQRTQLAAQLVLRGTRSWKV